MDKIVAQIKDMKIFVRKDTDVEYDAMLYSFGCRRMHLLETANEEADEIININQRTIEALSADNDVMNETIQANAKIVQNIKNLILK